MVVTTAALKATKTRQVVLWVLCALYLISYLDRVAISVTAPEMIKEFKLTKTQMGLIFAAFAYSYGLLQIVGGTLGDYFGPRKVLTLLMSWWSAFSAFTALGWNLASFIVIRFLFGVGEAGGFPVATRAMSSWFPPEARGWLQGITHAASRFGAAVAPPVVVFLMVRYGWRSVFYILGAIGFAWAAGFYWYYRDDPHDHAGVNEAELAIINKGRAVKKKAKRKFPWGGIVRNPNIWMLVFSDFCYGYTLWVYIAWLPTYLVQGRGFTLIKMGIYGSLPLLGGMVGDIVGGLASDYLYKKTNRLKLARCSVTFVAFVGAIVFTLLGAFANDARIAVLGLTAAFFFLETANANLWAIAMDLGGVLYSGTVSGIMNTGFGIAGMVSPIAFGMIVDRTGSWIYPFMVGTALLALGAITILIVNPTKEIKFAPEEAVAQPSA